MPGFAGRLGVPHATLECLSCARQAKRHADVVVRRTLASADTGQPHELPRRGPVEPLYVDADAELLTLARAVSSASRQATITLQNPNFLNLLDRLSDELLNACCLTPATFSWEAFSKEHLHMVLERHSRDIG